MSEKDVKIVKSEDGQKWVKGNLKMTYGQRRRYKTLQAPKEMRYQGDDVVAKLDFTQENDPFMFILEKMLIGWSKDVKISRATIDQDTELGSLMDEFVEEVQEYNGLIEKDEDAKN